MVMKITMVVRPSPEVSAGAGDGFVPLAVVVVVAAPEQEVMLGHDQVNAGNGSKVLRYVPVVEAA